MDAIVSLSKSLVGFFLTQLIFSAIMAALVFPVARLLGARQPLLVLGLWGLVVARLLLPLDLASPVSGRTLVDAIVERTNDGAAAAKESAAVPANRPAVAGPASAVANSPLPVVLSLVWLVCFLSLTTLTVVRARAYRRLIRESAPVTDAATVALVEKWKALFRVRRHVAVVAGGRAISPFTLGTFRPVVYVPRRLLARSGPAIRESIIAHEMAHIKALDGLWIGLLAAVQLVYFFNPFAWITGRQIRRLREEACDASVVTRRRLSRKAYGRAVLSVARLNPAPAAISIVPPGFSEKKRELGKRLVSLKRARRAGKATVALSLSIVLLAAAVVLPMAAFPSGPHFASPIVGGRIALEYGLDWNAQRGSYDPHKGIDIVAPWTVADVLAAADGTVVTAGRDEIFPEYREVSVLHPDGFVTRYLHLVRVFTAPNRTVRRGEPIGRIDLALHFEILQNGKRQDPENHLTMEKGLIREVKKSMANP